MALLASFALFMSTVTVYFCLSSFIFTLSIGLEKRYANDFNVGNLYITSSLFSFFLGCTLFILMKRKQQQSPIVYFWISTLIFISALSTWSGSITSGPAFVSSVAWFLLFRSNNPVPQKDGEKLSNKRKNPSRKLSSLSSNINYVKETSRQLNRNDKAELILQSLIYFSSILVFAFYFLKFSSSLPLQIAKGFAAVINLNLALLSLPVLHRVWSLLFQTCFGMKKLRLKSIKIHRFLVHNVLIASLIHLQAHLALLATSYGVIYLKTSWVTGYLLITLFFGMYGWSRLKPSRKGFFRVHLILGLVGIILLSVHCVTTLYWCIPAIILNIVERFIAFYSLYKKEIKLEKISTYGGKGTILQLTFSGNMMLHGGEYIYVNVASLGTTEWRPFSVIPDMTANRFSIYIRTRPNVESWTNKLHRKVTSNGFDLKSEQVLIDGPHLSPASNYLKFERLLLIAAGVGCTPVMSILRTIRLKVNHDVNLSIRHLTLVWILSLKEFEEFKWMIQEIYDSVQWFQHNKTKLTFRFHIYVTGCDSSKPLETVNHGNLNMAPSFEEMFFALSNPKNPSSLQAALSNRDEPLQVWRGRPIFASLLSNENQNAMARLQNSEQKKIGIFCCGPTALVQDLRTGIHAVSAKQLLEEADRTLALVMEDAYQTEEAQEREKHLTKRISFILHAEEF